MTYEVIYILGLFESADDDLYQSLNRELSALGYQCYPITLYPKTTFGAYPLPQEIERIRHIQKSLNPSLVLAHSLGAYISLLLHINCPVLLLDPSFPIAELLSNNSTRVGNTYMYDDGESRFALPPGFMDSLLTFPLIDQLGTHRRLNNLHGDIFILGAGKGGARIAERYLAALPGAQYTRLPSADHTFSGHEDRQYILSTALDILRLTADEEDVRRLCA